jgi:hypothetical protein
VGLRAVLDAVVKKKILSPAGNRTPIIQPVALCFFFLTEHHSMKAYWGLEV